MSDARHSHQCTDRGAIVPLLLQHLDAEERWMNTVLAHFEGIQSDLAVYDLDAVARHLAQLQGEERASTVLTKQRHEMRERLAAALGVAGSQATLSGLLQHIDAEQRALVRSRQRDLLLLSRRVAAAQNSAQGMIAQVYAVSRMFLAQLFGEDREAVRYSADGDVDRSARGQILEVRS